MRYLTDFDGFLMWRDEPQVEFSIRDNTVVFVSVFGDHLPIENDDFRIKFSDEPEMMFAGAKPFRENYSAPKSVG